MKRKLFIVLFFLLHICSQLPAQDLEKVRWIHRLVSAGKKHYSNFHRNQRLLEPFLTSKASITPCLKDSSHTCYKPYNEALAATYYDLGHSFYELKRLTDKDYWMSYGHEAVLFYRDAYVFPNNGMLPGYWIFTEGLLEHFQQTKDPRSKEAILLLANNAAFARDTTDPSETISTELSREVAYVILAYIRAENLGSPPKERLPMLVEHALGHLSEWSSGRANYVRPFMVALTAKALSEYHDYSAKDSKLQKKIRIALIHVLDYLWESLWVPTSRAFRYTNRVINDEKDMQPTADLSMLIAPAYRWVFKRTQLPRFLSRAKQISSGAVEKSFLDNPKQFNQNLFWAD